MSTPLHSAVNNSDPYLGSDDSFYYLFPAIVQCFTIILAGYFAGRFGLIDNHQSKGIGTYVTKFALPAVFFNVMVSLDFESVNWRLVFAVSLSKCIIYVLTIFISLLMHRPVNIGVPAISAIFTTQTNDVALGYPILNVLFPQYAPHIYLFAPAQLILLNPISFMMMEWHRSTESNTSVYVPLTGSTSVTSQQPPDTQNGTVASSSFDGSRSNTNRLRLRLFSVVKNTFLNPLIFMTIIGIVFNFILQRKVPLVVELILKVLGDSFAATALFFLGTGMVGKISRMNRKGTYMVVLLLLTKLLFAPFLTREMVHLFHPGNSRNDSMALTTFGFIYGSIPTAPPVFLFASQYHLIPQVIGSALVIGTFLSAPLMFLSARLVTLNIVDESEYNRLLQMTSLNISIISLLGVIWVAILFTLSKRATRVPHFFTMFWLLNIFLMCLGRIVDYFISPSMGLQTWPEYLQFVVFFIGVNGSRTYTSLLALALFLLKYRGLCFVLKHRYLIILVGFCVPTIITGLLLVATQKQNINRVDPIFKLGSWQLSVSLGVLLINIPLTIGLLIMQGRYSSWHVTTSETNLEINNSDRDSETYSQVPLIHEENSSSTSEDGIDPNNFQATRDIDFIQSHSCPVGTCTESERRSCRRPLVSYLREQSDNLPVVDEPDKEKLIERIRKEFQIDRHNILIIILLISMCFGTFLCLWRLVNESRSGIYIFLEFLDLVFNFGQGFMAFATFGLDPKLIIIPCIQRIRKLIYGTETVHLPPEDCLDDSTIATREQFIRYHMKKCYQEIAGRKTYRYVVYSGSFTGKELIDWLMRAGLAPDRLEALAYGKRLFNARVLHHVKYLMNLNDADYLYQFSEEILNSDEFNRANDQVSLVCGAYVRNPSRRRPRHSESSTTSAAAHLDSSGSHRRVSENLVDIEDLVSSYDNYSSRNEAMRQRVVVPIDEIVNSKESCQHFNCKKT